MSLRMTAAAIAWLAASLAGAAMACQPAPEQPPDAVAARVALEEAVVVLDAEVVNRGGEGWDAWVELAPLKVWKGLAQDRYRLRYLSSCDVDMEEFPIGARYRLLLRYEFGGYRADGGDNGGYGNPLAFNAEIDRLLGSPRPADFRD